MLYGSTALPDRTATARRNRFVRPGYLAGLLVATGALLAGGLGAAYAGSGWHASTEVSVSGVTGSFGPTPAPAAGGHGIRTAQQDAVPADSPSPPAESATVSATTPAETASGPPSPSASPTEESGANTEPSGSAGPPPSGA